jgi:hypothetical protein
MDQESRIFNYLNLEDRDGNGIWHYLADTLRQNEGASTLKIARTLLTMDIDFSRRNKLGMSPLSKMLLPSPRWQSLNALLQTKHLTIENIENAINERAKEPGPRNHLMTMIFTSDIADNRGLLSQYVLHQAVQPQADITLRAATCRLFFEYFDAEQGRDRLLQTDHHRQSCDVRRPHAAAREQHGGDGECHGGAGCRHPQELRPELSVQEAATPRQAGRERFVQGAFRGQAHEHA